MNNSGLQRNDLHWTCPKCGQSLDDEPVLWGEGWDYDSAVCPFCGYDGLLDTITGTDPDGTFYQENRKELEAEDEEE